MLMGFKEKILATIKPKNSNATLSIFWEKWPDNKVYYVIGASFGYEYMTETEETFSDQTKALKRFYSLSTEFKQKHQGVTYD